MTQLFAGVSVEGRGVVVGPMMPNAKCVQLLVCSYHGLPANRMIQGHGYKTLQEPFLRLPCIEPGVAQRRNFQMAAGREKMCAAAVCTSG